MLKHPGAQITKLFTCIPSSMQYYLLYVMIQEQAQLLKLYASTVKVLTKNQYDIDTTTSKLLSIPITYWRQWHKLISRSSQSFVYNCIIRTFILPGNLPTNINYWTRLGLRREINWFSYRMQCALRNCDNGLICKRILFNGFGWVYGCWCQRDNDMLRDREHPPSILLSYGTYISGILQADSDVWCFLKQQPNKGHTLTTLKNDWIISCMFRSVQCGVDVDAKNRVA
jgi:hypothetical protein